MKRTKGIKPPASRDAIESWLDVLVSMLNLPPSQRGQVRDELEDHIRSRVDDLLILGQPESQAIQTAIHELGETAELAKLISTASRTRTPFRRFAMNATFFVLAGSMMTAGISMMLPSSTLPTSSEITHNQPDADSVKPTHEKGLPTATFDFENAAFMEKFGAIAEAFGDKIQPSKGFTQLTMSDPAFYMTSPFRGEFTKIEALSELRRQYPAIDFKTKMTVGATFVMIQTREEADRASIRVEAYPMPVWAETRDDQLGFSNSVQELIHVKHDLEFTSIQAINGMLVVAAPPEVHAEIHDMAAQLKGLAEEMQAKNQARREQQRQIKQRLLKRLREEYEDAKLSYFAVSREHGKLLGQLSELDQQRLGEINTRSTRNPRTTEEKTLFKEIDTSYLSKITAMKSKIKEHQFEVEEAKVRFERLREILVDTEADLILSDLNDPILLDSFDSEREDFKEMHTVAINGTGAFRPGIYRLPSAGKLRVSQFLMSSGAIDSDSNVELRRNGELKELGTVEEIMSGRKEPINLQADDEIIVSARTNP